MDLHKDASCAKLSTAQLEHHLMSVAQNCKNESLPSILFFLFINNYLEIFMKLRRSKQSLNLRQALWKYTNTLFWFILEVCTDIG